MCSSDQSLVIVAFLWEKLSQPQFYKELTRKTVFFEGLFWFKFNNLGLALGENLKFYTSVAKGLKVKVRKFLGLIPTFVEVTGKKLVGVNNIERFNTMHSLDFIKNISILVLVLKNEMLSGDPVTKNRLFQAKGIHHLFV